MEVLGRVKEKLDENNIKVEILRASACGGKCGECGNTCGSKSYIIVKNCDGAKKDDVVKIQSDDKKVLGLSFVVFIVPILIIVLFYSYGSYIIESETLKALFAFLGGVISFLIAVVFFRGLKKPVSKIYYSSENNEYKI